MKLSTMRLPCAYTGARYVLHHILCGMAHPFKDALRNNVYNEEQLPANVYDRVRQTAWKIKKDIGAKKKFRRVLTEETGIAFSRAPWRRRRRTHLSEFPVIAPTNASIEPARAGFVAAVLIRLPREREREGNYQYSPLSGEVRWLLSVQFGIASCRKKRIMLPTTDISRTPVEKIVIKWHYSYIHIYPHSWQWIKGITDAFADYYVLQFN